MKLTNLCKRVASVIILLVMPCSKSIHAQEWSDKFSVDSAGIEKAAQQYLDHKISAWNKVNQRANRTTKRFIQKIKKQEQNIAQKLKNTDTTRYQQFLALRGISADSLQQQLSDSASVAKIQSLKSNTSRGIDSIKRIGSFLDKYGLSSKLSNIAATDKIQEQFSLQQYSQKVMQDRSKAITRLLEGSALSGQRQKLANINNQYRQQIQYWKQILSDPDAAEEKAMDYLRGTDGFEEHLSGSSKSGNNALAGKSAEELQQMGYQTKAAVNQQLQQAFGNQLDNVQQQAAAQLQQYTDKLGKGLDKVKDARQNVKEAKALAKETKGSLNTGESQIQKPKGFKNTMRNIPFWHRWELQYNFQSQRASADGLKPVMLQTGINTSYKQTEQLSLGIGLDGSIGLGRNWQNVKLSYEGLVARAFLDYKIIWGFSMQGGYEKSLRPINRPYTQLQEQYGNESNIKTAMGLLQDAAYIGIMKRYKINSKLQGTMLFGYNFLNDKTNISSPWIVRMGWKL